MLTYPTALLLTLAAGSVAAQLTAIEQLGKNIFFDTALSINHNQSCAACHALQSGWTGPDSTINAHGAVYEGSIAGRFGNRKPPSSAYATPSPVLHYVDQAGEIVFIGGNFWDGRATGEKLGSPAADQAQGPFLNPVEQALPDSACIVYEVCTAPRYGGTFEQVWGTGTCDIAWPADIETLCAQENVVVPLSDEDRTQVDTAYNDVALSIAAYEASREVNQFSAKYDAFLAGRVTLTDQESQGLTLFQANCTSCHSIELGANGEPPLFTSFTYANVGVPRNPENPWYTMPAVFNPLGFDWIDLGLGGFLASRLDYELFAPANYGKHKVPTLRNVDKRPNPAFVKAYTHNGYFKSLKGVVHFYNTRDVLPICPDLFTTEAEALAQGCWPLSEVLVNVNTTAIGNLGLTDADEDAIVAFLKTLSDDFRIPRPAR
jgi:cytochrome c peroxidase